LLVLLGGCTFEIGALSPTDAAVNVQPDLTVITDLDPLPQGDLAGADLSQQSDLSQPDLSHPDMKTSPADMAQPQPDLKQTPPDMVQLPVLSGTRGTFSNDINLTTEGQIDWAHFGLTQPDTVNRKNVGVNVITAKGTGTVERWPSYQSRFDWSDGTPTASVNNTQTGVFQYGQGSSFGISVPAGTTTRTVKVYCSNYRGIATMVAHLSDSSAPDYTDSVSAVFNEYLVYTFTFRAGSAGKTLDLTWTLTTDNGGTVGTGSVDLFAITYY
jgi:hypothetical protein